MGGPRGRPRTGSRAFALQRDPGYVQDLRLEAGRRPSTAAEHLERHRWEASPEGQREYGRLTAVLRQDGPVWLRRRLGLLLWKLHDRGKSPPQIARDIRVPLPVVAHALSVPKGQRAGVHHLHHLGLLSREIAQRLELPGAAVDRNLRSADWTLWLERCCPPGWASRPLL